MKLTDEQVKCIKTLQKAIKKCTDTGLGIGMEDYSLYVANFKFVTSDEFESPWDFIRKHNDDDEIVRFISMKNSIGAGGA
jgi:hypothetical protein